MALKKEEILTFKELEEILDNSFDGILVTDGKGNPIYVNDSYERHTGITRKELIGHNMKELLNPVYMKRSVALDVLNEKKPISIKHTTKIGKNIIVTGTPVFLKDGKTIKAVVINTRDITEIYELQNKIEFFTKLAGSLTDKKLIEKENKKDNIPENIVVVNDKQRGLYKLAKQIANFDTTVIIYGETGVGKDVLANYIHQNSMTRKSKPFIPINCGAVPKDLLESELFGYGEGTFTGGKSGGKAGIIEATNGGTLFLDEIGEMSLDLQVKFLRVLEDGYITRLGETKKRPVNFRVIAATHKKLSKLVNENKFREDLYYRLNVISFEIPPLRERKDEIVFFVKKFLNLYNGKYGLSKSLTDEAMLEFTYYNFPGNIRELKNIIERLIVTSFDDEIDIDKIPWLKGEPSHEIGEESDYPSELTYKEQKNTFERTLFENAKKKYKTTREASEALGIDQSTVVRKYKEFNIED